LGAALLLAGCGDRSASGTYVSHTANDATLLQLTEMADHRFTGTLRHASLNNDGTLSSSEANVTGSVDGNSITLTVLATPFPVGQNFSGTVSSAGIDLTVPQGAQTAVEHYEKGELSDYNAVVYQFTQAGAPVIAARQRGQQVDRLNHQVNTLTQDVNAFVARAHEIVERSPRAVAYYAKAVSVEQGKLDRAQQLAAIRNGVAQGQAGVVVGQMGVDKAQISNTDDAITRAQAEVAAREETINVGLSRWKTPCVDGAGAKSDAVTPDVGPCEALSHADAAYHAVLPSLHAALTSAVQAKAHSHEQLATIWRAADNVH
jgi:hypothetical protein